MVFECLSRDKIEGCLNSVKNPETTHVSIEGEFFVQYKCNPTKEIRMNEVSSDVTSFRVYERRVGDYVFSRGIETIGEQNQKTFYYQA
jgi:hypothetical protein